MTEIKPDKIPYDAWFDDNIPQAQYGSLQCWIANESTAKWSTEVDITLPVSYTHLTLPTNREV